MGRPFNYSKILSPFCCIAIVSLFFGLSAKVEETVYPVVVDPTISNADWIPMNGVLGAQGNVTCMAFAKGILFLGGHFTTVGSLHVPYFATWDGSSWDSLGSLDNEIGIPTVQACAVGKDGNPVIASYDKVARWNGEKWAVLTSLRGVNAIACDGKGTTYISITNPGQGEQFSSYIARWDGSAWSKLGTGVDSVITALTCDKNGNLFATGHFLSAGGKPASRIAKWDGTNWSTLGAGLNDYGSSLSFDSSGMLFVGGNFDSAGGVTAKRIAQWDGATWSPLGSGIAESYWNTGNLVLTCDGSGNVYVAGHFDTAGEKPAKNIAKWNGTGWEPLGSGVDALSDAYPPISCLTYDGLGNVYIGGYFNDAGGVRATCIARWDGSAWHSLYSKTAAWGTNNVIKDQIVAFAFDNAGSLYARSAGFAKLYSDGWQYAGPGRILRNVGRDEFLPTDTTGVNISAFNGAFKSPFIGSRRIYLAACDGKGNLFCASADTALYHYFFRWNGNAWDSIGYASGFLQDMVCDGEGNFYVNLIYSTSDRKSGSSILKWDGLRLSEFAKFSGIYTQVINAMVCDSQGNLYVAGNFNHVNEFLAYSIAKWNGTEWENLGNPGEYLMNEFYSLALDDKGQLYAGSTCLYRFDGAFWSQLGTPIGLDFIRALIVIDSFVFIGGNFQNVSGKYSPSVAKVNVHRPVDAVIGVPVRAAPPVPHYRIVNSILFIANSTPLDRVFLYSLSGRCVCKAVGASPVSLSGLSPQSLVIRIMRGAKTIESGRMLVP